MSDTLARTEHRLGQPQTALRLEHVSKTFAATKALDTVDLRIDRGEIRCLVGGNGSGKSTLVKILAGVHRGDAGGHLEVNGVRIRTEDMTPALAREAGLRFVHQNPGLFMEMTIAENVALGSEFPGRRPGIGWRALKRRTADLLERYGIEASPDDRVGDLRPADCTMVAVARALQDWETNEISVLVLDEATASLPQHEVTVLLDAIRRCAQTGQTVIFVSHRLDEVLAIADSVSVLRDGKHAATRTRSDVDRNILIEDIVGRSIITSPAQPAALEKRPGAHLLEVRGISGGPLQDVSLHVDPGEIVGIAGLLGSGRTELLRTIFGAFPGHGEIYINAKLERITTPAKAMELGIAYVPEDREVDAAFLAMPVRENITIGALGKYWSRGRFAKKDEERDTNEHIDAFGIVTHTLDQLLATLSGGNQQKVILSRWMNRRPQLLLLDEPTQGVDVGARADVHRAIRASASRGMGVLIVSSDFEELAQATDRVLILHDGRVTADLPTAGLDSQAMSRLVFSGRSSA